jgi:hypothetical protein
MAEGKIFRSSPNHKIQDKRSQLKLKFSMSITPKVNHSQLLKEFQHQEQQQQQRQLGEAKLASQQQKQASYVGVSLAVHH